MKPLKMLILEESKIDTALVVDELKQGGFDLFSERVDTAETMKTALSKEPWDVIVSDYTMSRFSALAALAVLQHSGLDIPFIIVSGSIGEEIAVEALKKGANDYLMKGNLARLVPAIERETREVQERKTRKQVEDALKETENTYRRLVDGVKDYGIFMLDPQGKVLSWNAGAERITGYTTDEILGQAFSMFYLEEDIQQDKPEIELKAALAHGGFESESIRVRNGQKTFYAQVVITPVYHELGQLIGYSVITRDITERKDAEEKIKVLAAELEQRVRERTDQLEQVNRELESFSYSVSHDLQAPVRNLLSLCKKLLSRYGNQLDEEGNTFLEYIMESGQQIHLLINDLLNLSRVSQNTLRLTTINLSEMVNDVVRNLKARDPDRQVEVEITKGISVTGDASLLKIALQNLLENAWKFTSKIPQATIIFGEIPYQGKVAYFIRDNGVGFDPAYQDRLFTAFQRLHGADEYPGSGIGLATVQRIIHRHGGKVWAKGDIDHGACFYFTL